MILIRIRTATSQPLTRTEQLPCCTGMCGLKKSTRMSLHAQAPTQHITTKHSSTAHHKDAMPMSETIWATVYMLKATSGVSTETKQHQAASASPGRAQPKAIHKDVPDIASNMHACAHEALQVSHAAKCNNIHIPKQWIGLMMMGAGTGCGRCASTAGLLL